MGRQAQVGGVEAGARAVPCPGAGSCRGDGTLVGADSTTASGMRPQAECAHGGTWGRPDKRRQVRQRLAGLGGQILRSGARCRVVFHLSCRAALSLRTVTATPIGTRNCPVLSPASLQRGQNHTDCSPHFSPTFVLYFSKYPGWACFSKAIELRMIVTFIEGDTDNYRAASALALAEWDRFLSSSSGESAQSTVLCPGVLYLVYLRLKRSEGLRTQCSDNSSL